MNPNDFVMPLIGGALIGLASAILLLFNGRIAGVSGIMGGLMSKGPGEGRWRSGFIAGLIVVGAIGMIAWPSAFAQSLPRSPWALGVAGLLVGVGTRMGSGCTSGHGVCGIGRLSPRSIVATLVFIATGMITVAIVRHGFGGYV